MHFFSHKDASPPKDSGVVTISVSEALKNLKKAITTSPDSSGPSDIDKDTQEFLYNWLQNNKSHIGQAQVTFHKATLTMMK